MIPRWPLRLALMLLVCLGAGAAEWSVRCDLATQTEVVIAVAPGSLTQAQALRLNWRLTGLDSESTAQVEVALITADHRFFTVASSLDAGLGQTRVPLTARYWAGLDGTLGPDALAGIVELRWRVHGLRAGVCTATIAAVTGEVPLPSGQRLVSDGLVQHGPWRELRLELLGEANEVGELDLLGGPRPLPAFRYQPSVLQEGRWRPVGGPCWVVRLRPGEEVARLIPQWRDGARSWRGAALPALAVTATAALPTLPAAVLEPESTAPWNGTPLALTATGWTRQPSMTLPSAVAPTLIWRQGWTGYRGEGLLGDLAGLVLDRALAADPATIDLLPEGWFTDGGRFRVGLAPWLHGAAAATAFASDQDWSWLPTHVRAVVARARACPALTTWRIGVAAPVGVADQARFTAVMAALATQVANLDERPLLASHPDLTSFGYGDRTQAWQSFGPGPNEWNAGPAPLRATIGIIPEGSIGPGLGLDFPPGSAVRSTGAWIPLDTNWFQLDTLRFDASLAGGGAAVLVAWVTDAAHHWYQQPLGVIDQSTWTTRSVDFRGSAPWRAVGHDRPWNDTIRWRVRAFGLMAFRHAGGDGPASLRLDEFRRFGWPLEAIAPTLALSDDAPAATTLPRWRPLMADFHLSLPARNPFDPDQVDVVAEIEGPGGLRRTWPCYWSEPTALDWQDGAEVPRVTGPGGWHLRFTPTLPGTWRYRLRAKLLWRDQWLTTEGAWRAVTVVPGADDGQAPIGAAKQDPQWLEDADGHFFYPIGPTLRSPEDERQQQVLTEAFGQVSRPAGDRNDLRRPLGTSKEFARLGTRAYERWFPQLAANGANWARVWMCPWFAGLEWNRQWSGFGGLTWFNQHHAAQLDRVFELAERSGIRLQIELQNHGMTGIFADRQWQDSPYSKRNGGPCDPNRPDQWYTSDAVWTLHAKRLRYTVARWGWRTSNAAWVLTSEMEFTGGYRADTGGDESAPRAPIAAAWTKRSLDWFKANDNFQRPVSVHFSHPWEGQGVWSVPGLGFNYSNAYTAFQDGLGHLGGNLTNRRRSVPMAMWWYLTNDFDPARYHRPTLIGEWGGHWEFNNSANLEGELRTGVWLQAVMPYAGNTGWWWWLWMDATGRWNAYKPVAAYLKGEDPRGQTWRVLRPTVPADRHLNVLGMASDRHLRLYAVVIGGDQDPTKRRSGDAGALALEGFAAGTSWQWQRWDTATGTPLESVTLVVDKQGRLEVPLGLITFDGAWKGVRR